ncbi:hypothetical protein GOP47_0023443 [Adiantum capillus-veneris]|uniref:Bifunctional inhibitor/plant lipid transfer protein/seed storage helical domain-containing protein n=1 Tax=Adiantum capillus-veneris TaxID=13818 RepID=A0A9D4Z3D7_ADICA|nr:hypothetical protein GOP47_0023443 [Adiantum capillus-veneris]
MAHTRAILLLLLLLGCAAAGSAASDAAASSGGGADGIVCPLFCLENVKYSKCKSLGPHKRLPAACNCCLLRRALLESSPRYSARTPSKCSLHLSHGKVVRCDF